MWLLLLIVTPAMLALGYKLGQHQQPNAKVTTEADAVVAFLRVINARMDTNTALAVRGVAWEAYRGPLGEYMRGELERMPMPPVEG